jgi:vacuolar protein sorting-associated protein 13A/C
MKVANEIPRVFAGMPDTEAGFDKDGSTSVTANKAKETLVDFEPELRSSSGRNWSAVDLVVHVNAIKLHLYDGFALSEDQLKDHGIARFALNDNTLRFKLLSSGAGEAQVILQSFTMSNTRPGQTKFREIIPAAQHSRNQFMLLYTMSGGQGSSLAVLTVDSPQIIFAIDPVISLLEFFTSAFKGGDGRDFAPNQAATASSENYVPEQNLSSFDFRIDLHDVSISVLENDVDPESRAIRLYISKVLLSQQVRVCVALLLPTYEYAIGNPCFDRQPPGDVSHEDGQNYRKCKILR